MSSDRKVAIVTGASRGIGYGLVKGFCELGYNVVANSRSITSNDFVDTPNVIAVAGDISLSETAERAVRTALDRFGRVDTLVNNAGLFVPKSFVEYDEADFLAMVALNLAGFFHISQKAATRMLNAGSGHIVNITAAIAEQPIASVPAALAALTKGGLNAVTGSLAIEYASRGIRVNAVSPGAIKTSMHSDQAHGFLATSTQWVGWGRRARSSMPSSFSRRPPSSRVRSCTLMAAPMPAAGNR